MLWLVQKNFIKNCPDHGGNDLPVKKRPKKQQEHPINKGGGAGPDLEKGKRPGRVDVFTR
jgi:hypothetical protein